MTKTIDVPDDAPRHIEHPNRDPLCKEWSPKGDGRKLPTLGKYDSSIVGFSVRCATAAPPPDTILRATDNGPPQGNAKEREAATRDSKDVKIKSRVRWHDPVYYPERMEDPRYEPPLSHVQRLFNAGKLGGPDALRNEYGRLTFNRYIYVRIIAEHVWLPAADKPELHNEEQADERNYCEAEWVHYLTVLDDDTRDLLDSVANGAIPETAIAARCADGEPPLYNEESRSAHAEVGGELRTALRMLGKSQDEFSRRNLRLYNETDYNLALHKSASMLTGIMGQYPKPDDNTPKSDKPPMRKWRSIAKTRLNLAVFKDRSAKSKKS